MRNKWEAPYSESEMYAAMLDRVILRNSKYDIHVVDTWPKLTEIGEDIILGSFSWLGMTTGTRWVYAPSMVKIGGEICTPGDVCRDYLSVKFAERQGIVAAQRDEVMIPRPHPLYYTPMHYTRAVYVDIKASYMSMMSVVGWNVDYNPGRWLARGEGMSDFPFSGVKRVRNCLVTAGLKGRTKIYLHDKRKVIVRHSSNRWINYQLWAITHDILMGIAHDVRPYVSYVHTDGCICHEDDYPIVAEIYRSWGMPTGIKHRGSVYIYGPGRYTFNPQPGWKKPFPLRDTDNIYPIKRHNWLRERVKWLSMFANPVLPREELLCSTC